MKRLLRCRRDWRSDFGQWVESASILDAIRLRMLDAETVVVVSNRKNAFGLDAGAPVRPHHPLKPYGEAGRSREGMTPTWRNCQGMRRTGWCWRLDAHLSNAFCSVSYRVVNLHPALPGSSPAHMPSRRLRRSSEARSSRRA